MALCEIRDALDRKEEAQNASWASTRLFTLKGLDPSNYPSDPWRAEYRKTQARLEELVNGPKPPAPRPSSPPAPPLIPDRAAFTRTFKLRPNNPDKGKMDGAFVTSLSPECVLAKAGVKEGDLMVEVNDRPLDSVNYGINLVSFIEQDRGFWGVVRRGDARISFRVEFPGNK